ncbi:hypothetical protein CC85DRAFT_296872 [Cutaneotrichosporon oleaginosum]|uniref:Man(5)GlcNAc(2)-PP-dolichol translocation protein RFT1 n=1 Tax=Cutaneotrichosporon oleaginosum TaxID=879819 RepID=A0A0J0XKU9_9TREE|nr:uncharacterized protein CC85DRAFT_296872 [Cutaneotrichosporon oleaginosum]KLT41758.1 hypothetical protein CC85DRAFT_296872 [Cutaneotrichosporon oleaginosum]TXT12354.1 hypothetical protein COLE_02764 [Cutaneotrichosporon oleaginosum]
MPTTRAQVRNHVSGETPPPNTPSPASSDASALATGRALVLLQLLSRALTFVLNQGLVRHAPPSVFGTAAIQFDLVAATILFLSREGVRTAVLRTRASVSVWPLRLGVAVSAATLALYLGTAPASTTRQPYFYPSLALYVLGALAELAVEPLYVRATRGDIATRVAAEGGQAGVRTALSFALLVALPRLGDAEGRTALLGLALGYFAGSAWLAARYIWAYGGTGALRGLVVSETEGDTETRRLAIAGTRQSVVKHLLTEADRIAVGYISPLGDQGGYAVAINYGSLVARILFQPLEETLRLHWSRRLSSRATLPLLAFAVRLSTHLLLLLPVFIPPLLPPLLPLLLPRKYAATNAAATLQAYLTFYIPLLSLNGILEAFHAASATPAQVAHQAWAMGASSAAFVLALWRISGVVSREEALVYASCVGMGVRIAYAASHAVRYARARERESEGEDEGQRLRLRLRILPHPAVFAAVGAAGALMWSAARLHGGTKDTLTLLAVGGASGIGVLGMM